MQNTITLDQARQDTIAYVQQVGAALPGKPRLEPNAGGIITLGCNDPEDNGPRGRESVGGNFFLQDIPAEQNPEVFDFLRAYLMQQGFRVRTQQADSLVMENPKDGFRVGLRESGDGTKVLSLIVSSPCVWPNGKPPS